MSERKRDDRILPTTRALAVLVIPFLVVAFAILYATPERTDRWFAWALRPTMSAMMLGSAYAGGVLFFASVWRGRRWHEVANGFPAVATFATLLGIATLMHWDRFQHDHVSFYAWAGLYFTTPFLVVAAAWRNHDHARRNAGPIEPEQRVPTLVRVALAGVGATAAVGAVLLFAAPTLMGGVWPWSLSPLTARVMSALFTLPAVVGLAMAIDARWSAARPLVRAQVLSIALILLATARARNEFDWSSAASWGFVVGLGALLTLLLATAQTMDGRARRARQPR